MGRIRSVPRPLLLVVSVATALAGLGGHAGGTSAAGAAPAAGPAPPARVAAVAGAFYPAEATILTAAVDGYLAGASAPLGPAPVAIVAPHAGYVFCGAVLGEAWRQARGHSYDLIVVLGTNHTAPAVDGMAVWRRGDWQLPTGVVRVDAKAADELLAADPQDCIDDERAHLKEHSIEVQLPFVQRLFPRVPILPVIVGTTDLQRGERFARALASVIGPRRALLVASSDLSHYPPRSVAERVDKAVLRAIAAMDPAGLQSAIGKQMRTGGAQLVTCACGEAPILAAMAAAHALGGVRGTAIAYANSGDVPQGDATRVVGYGAVTYTRAEAPDATLAPDQRQLLLQHARAALREALIAGQAPRPRTCPEPLAIPRGAFVTLHEQGELRGCIGRLEADTPLCDVVAQMALQAALHDPRFAPVTAAELPLVVLEISVLTPPRPVAGPEQIVVGRDGVVLRKGSYGAVFLPQVATEQGWSLEEMLRQLSRKAGLDADAWRSGAQLSTFQAEVFSEAPLR